jgi:uncharacterized membrane protein YdjX (TVP38/TMEM64 family)
MNRRKLIIRISIYITLVLSLLIGLKLSGFKVSNLTVDNVLAAAHHNIFLILIIMLLIMILQNLFTFIPLVLVITINISIFGFWLGYLYSCFCSVIASTLIFLSIRYLFSNSFSSSKFRKFNEKIEENGFRFVLIGRILPFIPTNLINIVSGLSSMKITHFISATTIGNMIYGLVLSTASFSVITMFSKHPYWTISALVVVICSYLGLILMKKKQTSTS